MSPRQIVATGSNVRPAAGRDEWFRAWVIAGSCCCYAHRTPRMIRRFESKRFECTGVVVPSIFLMRQIILLKRGSGTEGGVDAVKHRERCITTALEPTLLRQKNTPAPILKPGID